MPQKLHTSLTRKFPLLMKNLKLKEKKDTMITFGSFTIVEIQLGKKSKKKGNPFVACLETSKAYSLLLKKNNGAVLQLSLPTSNRHSNPYELQGGGLEQIKSPTP